MRFINSLDEQFKEHYSLISNKFIQTYMLDAPRDYSLVYIYGLMIATKGTSVEHPEEIIAAALSITIDNVYQAYSYWNEVGLVDIIEKSPLKIKYLPISDTSISIKKYNVSKYKDFNKDLDLILKNNLLIPEEKIRFYDTLEDYDIDQDAMLMIVKYCINEKGPNVSVNYMLKVAKDWARQNIRSVVAVGDKILELSANSDYIKELFRVLGVRRSPDVIDKEYVSTWTKKLGFSQLTILEVAKMLKRKGGMEKLDQKLTHFYDLSCIELSEIEQHEKNKKNLLDLAISINKTFEKYHESNEFNIDTYISRWISLGFEIETLKKIALFCSQYLDIKTYKKMDEQIQEFFDKAMLTDATVSKEIERLSKELDVISKIIDKTSFSNRPIRSFDRESYNTWSKKWGFSDEFILLAAQMVQGQPYANTKMNSLLSHWKENNITSIESAQKTLPTNINQNHYKKPPTMKGRQASADELKRTFDMASESFKKGLEEYLKTEDDE